MKFFLVGIGNDSYICASDMLLRLYEMISKNPDYKEKDLYTLPFDHGCYKVEKIFG